MSTLGALRLQLASITSIAQLTREESKHTALYDALLEELQAAVLSENAERRKRPLAVLPVELMVHPLFGHLFARLFRHLLLCKSEENSRTHPLAQSLSLIAAAAVFIFRKTADEASESARERVVQFFASSGLS